MRLLARAWVIGCVGLTACQLVAGITTGSSHGPCVDDSECPATESCVAGHCQSKSGSGGAGAGAQSGTGGISGGAGDSGQTSTGGSAGRGGSSASGGSSGASQGGTTAAQGGDAGTGGVSGSGISEGGESGDGGGGEATGTGGGGAVAGGGAGGGTGGDAGNAGTGGVAGTTAGSAGLGGMAGSGGTGPIRIMALGDGITATTCMRAFLWQALRDNEYPAFDFVGSRVGADTCSPSEYDKDHEGHSGYRVSDVLAATSQHTSSDGDPYTGSSADLDLWFTGRPADIVLMLLGSNDFLSTTHSAADVQNAFSAILTKLRSQNPRVTLLVGLLPPMSTDQCDTSCASRRTDLNSALPTWASSVSTADSRVLSVDLSTGFDLENTTDGVKPNDIGAEFLAERWYAAIVSL